jgi:hypothetical protein
VDFQRYWSLWRAFELEMEGSPDYLLLFESVQDVLELNSETSPTAARIYQVKKKDSGEWSWKELTALDPPPTLKKDGTPRKKRVPKNPSTVPTFDGSPIGKLALSAKALSSLAVTAHFVSNAGCVVPLAPPAIGNASSAQHCSLSQVDQEYAGLLELALSKLVQNGDCPVPLKWLYLDRTTVHPDEPEDAIVGRANDLLVCRSPRHAAQARTLVRSLFAKVSPKGRYTGLCHDFAELRKRRGFSKSDLNGALGDLELVPDVDAIRTDWLSRLSSEGLGIVEHAKLNISLAQVDRDRLSGTASDEQGLLTALAEWVKDHPPGNSLLQFLSEGEKALRVSFPLVRRARLQALLLMEGITVWVVQVSEN